MRERFAEFDINKAGEALRSKPRETKDVAHGDGHALTAGETTIEVFRNARVARVTTPDARIELFRVPTYYVNPERVLFEQGGKEERTRLLVRSDGKVSFYPVQPAAESSETDATAPSDEVVSSTPAEPSVAVTERPEGIPGGDGEKQEPEQKQLSGRLGRDPWFGTRGDEPAAGFPLAVNDEQGKATWHRVVVVGELAEKLRTGRLKKGRLVELSGTEVVQTEATDKGGTRTTKEFHATTVNLTARRNTPPAK
jgi:hypothetical protein